MKSTTLKAGARSYVWLGTCIFMQAMATCCLKMAGLRSSTDNLLSLVGNSWYWAGILSLAIQALCWIQTLKSSELSLAYPMTSLVFGLNLAGAAFFFGEEIELTHLIGIGCIMGGVFLVNRDPQ